MRVIKADHHQGYQELLFKLNWEYLWVFTLLLYLTFGTR